MRMILFVLLSNQSNHVTQGHLSVLETLVSVQSSFVWTEEGQNCPFLFPSLREQRENETMSIKPSTLCTWSHRQCRGRLKRPSPQGHFLGSLQRQGNTPHPYLMLPTEGGNDRLSNKSADLPFLHHFKLLLCSPKLVIIFFFFFFKWNDIRGIISSVVWICPQLFPDSEQRSPVLGIEPQTLAFSSSSLAAQKTGWSRCPEQLRSVNAGPTCAWESVSLWHLRTPLPARPSSPSKPPLCLLSLDQTAMFSRSKKRRDGGSREVGRWPKVRRLHGALRDAFRLQIRCLL